MKIIRRRTREVRVGDIGIGADNPVRIQSMANTRTKDAEATAAQIIRLAEAGCEIARVGIPDMESAKALKIIKNSVSIPIVADIHYDHRLALECIENGADKIRINPGNIGGAEKLRRVVESAAAHSIPIRVGINCGSLEKDLAERYGGKITEEAAFESVKRNMTLMSGFGFDNIVISAKSSDVLMNYAVNKMISEEYDHPVHIGITESGSDSEGLVRSSTGLALLLKEGIGDTIRVSLSNDPVMEVMAAREILNSLGIRKTGVEIISCPTCARTEVDIIGTVRYIKEKTSAVRSHIKVAIMGCSVNGIGEAKDADVGIAGGKGEFLLFEKGKITGRADEANAAELLLRQIIRITNENEKIK